MTDLNALAAGIEADKTYAAIDNIEVHAGVETATLAPSGNEALRKTLDLIVRRAMVHPSDDHNESLRQLYHIKTHAEEALAALSTPAPAQQAVDVEAVAKTIEANMSFDIEGNHAWANGTLAAEAVLALINGVRDAGH